jgi:formate hydrogenlyase subunit 3/multisubunit Na+/H+ antiporter MnhD subunit
MSLLYLIALPLLASFLTPLYKNHLRVVSVVLHLVLSVGIGVLAFRVPLQEYVSFDSPLSITFVLDGASLLFTLLFIGVMLFVSLYHLNEESDPAFFIVTNLFLVGALGLVLSADLFNLYIFFEIASISAYILTSLNQDQKGYAGAIKYMIVGAVASIFLLLAVILIYLNIGFLTLSAIGEGFPALSDNLQRLILLLLFIGFGIKAEIFPLNFWVADIYQAAPTRSNALFSAILSKAYLFLFFHLVYTLKPEPDALFFLMMTGVVSFAVAELSALKSHDLKRIFAYSTLGQIGVAFVALASGDPVVVGGALFLIGIHAITKVLLFFGLDAVEQATGGTHVRLYASFRSPFLAMVFAIGFLSILGIPPLAGFIAKLTILKGLAASGHVWIAGILLAVTLIEATYFFRLLSSRAHSEKTVPVPISPLRRILLGLLAVVLIYLGLLPGDTLSLCTEAAHILLQGVSGVPHV